MPGTTTARDNARAQKWLRSTGGMAYVPPEAFDLLVRRLAARRRAALACTPFWTLAIVAYATLAFDYRSLGTPSWSRNLESRFIASYAIAAVGRVVYEVLSQRADRRIADSLPHRVSRSTAVSIPMMLGRDRMVYLVTIATADGLFAVALLVVGVGVAWAFIGGLALACGLVGLGMWRAARRPTVASEPVSLAIDERLRAEDAFRATSPLQIVIFAVFIGTQNLQVGSWLMLVPPAMLLAMAGMQMWALQRRPWPTVPSWSATWPGPRPASPPGEVGA